MCRFTLPYQRVVGRTSTNPSITPYEIHTIHSGVLLGSGEADAPLLGRDDARIRPVPFMVEPPSFAEVRVPVCLCLVCPAQ